MTLLPRVTIAMPAYNEEDYIEACIATVQAQDYPADRIEILVADGRSTDRTRDILARLATHDRRIHVIDNGCLAESGTHRELLSLGGLYARLYDIQYAPETREAV